MIWNLLIFLWWVEITHGTVQMTEQKVGLIGYLFLVIGWSVGMVSHNMSLIGTFQIIAQLVKSILSDWVRVLNSWFHDKRFSEVVKETWRSNLVKG